MAEKSQREHQQAGGPDEPAGNSDEQKLSLVGSVALGTGVMIGAGIFALVGQVAELAGGWVPWAFLAGAIVVAFSSYSYIRYSAANPSSGGIAMLLKAAYGPGVIAGSFSLFMYVSMILAESLLGRTFGTYVLRPFGLQDSALLVPVLAVLAIAAAALVNLVGNQWVERSATVTAALKIIGIAVLAIGGLLASGLSSLSRLFTTADRTPPESGWLGFLAGVTLCILAYKGFTTITNQGADLRKPERNVGRSIMIAIGLCTVLYLLITVAVTGSLTVPEIVDARDYALAEAAEPAFGSLGVTLTVIIAIIATLSGLIASLFSVSKLYDMLHDMGQAPGLPRHSTHQSLLITAGLAIVMASFFDLTQIASLGAILYLAMDIAIHWGIIRHLRHEIEVKPWVPFVAIVLDLAVLVPFLFLRAQSDPFTLIITAVTAAVLLIVQWLMVRRRSRHQDHAG
ncbi:APC family permease [Arthrobacter agilis]|uniref:APC family permease n=1 Tax=Arthrobacter agilis TaxID=37921 RepID=UPI000B362304|nr:APC family permease [Arthrobacter agilis]OUM42138.1 amino acid permease [Arthrobacter agilis]PPB45483.1 APC family permease [Arthrobacter agilis]TPV26541.1 APC family permease [Arthrobacter agilis]VDR33546.1 Inner membrane transport protein YbaT [Arthrobacter agilis]